MAVLMNVSGATSVPRSITSMPFAFHHQLDQVFADIMQVVADGADAYSCQWT